MCYCIRTLLMNCGLLPFQGLGHNRSCLGVLLEELVWSMFFGCVELSSSMHFV